MRFGLNLTVAAALAVILIGVPTPALAQHAQPAPASAAHAAPPQGGHTPQAGEHTAEGEQGNPVVQMIAKLFNFAILAGTLVYFLRSPIAGYLKDRGTTIRGDLVKAAAMKRSAAAQLAEVDKKLAALPGELEALRKTGAAEVAAEEARMRQAAEGERARLLEQATRDIEWQLRIAQRDLTKHAADLAVDLASARVKTTITSADQLRLVDRYVGQIAK
ncbi:MAG: ATP synthase F0 subunit B [Acidobacteria bacterium]|nr:ATP synthase F0 subunit B [Acidobacteriota bacterium]